MADVFDKERKIILKSVNTPDFMTDRYIVNPSFIPVCESKYIVIDKDDSIREMTKDERAVVDYVAPPPEPTLEEIKDEAIAERKRNIKNDITNIYPDIADEIQIIRQALAKEFPDNTDIQEYNTSIETIIAKYPKPVVK